MYAVVGGDEIPATLDEVAGVAGEPPRTVTAGRLAAVVGSVPLEVFGDAPLRRNLEDLDWLEAVARTHDAVVSVLLRQGAVVPLRLATVFLDDDRVRDLLHERRDDFESALALVRGRTEWGVKAYCDRAARTAAVAESDSPGTGTGRGTAYLRRRRAQLSAQETVERDAAARAEDIHRRLVRGSAAGRCQPLTDPVLSGTRDWMVLNGTYLVDDTRTDEFADTVRELGTALTGIRLELTGPWPPYSFAGVERDTS
ncbi:GvpL/GvpF family gas vesicle protein [Nocardia sp. NPDC024068]|uniref:GvpL/GvpF family gas vesicle protein n=1 Tax=Nocardia sp. NPDC024068 TaxID=3157197 RepID=UPI0033F2E674